MFCERLIYIIDLYSRNTFRTMLRCVRRCRLWLRMAQNRCMTTDPLLEQLNTCAGEEQVLQLVGQNEANLSVAHLGCAINLLWQFQKEKPYMMRTVGQIRDHPQFIALRGLTENKINLIDDNTLVEILYIMLRFTVVRHDSLIQQLVVEGWKRLDGLNPVALSKFSVCLTDQYLNESPIMGHIARIVDNNLDDLQDTRLEEGALKWVDEMSLLHLVYVLQAMEKMECRNYPLMQKIAKRLPSFLDLYRPNDLAKVAQALRTMHFQTPELFAQLQQVLRSKLKSSCIPSDVAKLAKTLAKLPSHQVDEEIVSKLEAILPQCTLSDVGNLVPAIFKWVQTAPASRRNPSSAPYGNLLKTINGFGIERVQKMDNINVLLDELKPSALPWLEEVLCVDVINTFDRLLDQVTLQNVPDISRFITRAHFFHPRLLNKVASVTTENITKIHHSKIYTILLPFCTFNYEPPQCEEFFDACIQHFLTHLSSFSPHIVVLTAYSLAVAGYYPKELVKYIFNIDFLGKLDTMSEIIPRHENNLVRHRLMHLNRAVCLECAEYQVPWFHDQYCQQVQRKVSIKNSVQHQIHQMLGEIFGGHNYVKISVMTPYYYSIDFECILDKNKNPIPYKDQKKHSDLSEVQRGLDKQLKEANSLPPGARRIAVEFLDSKAFCRNSSRVLGEYVMKKRHLEMLGYHVVQISSLEWNSMELSSKDAWKEYLQKSIFEDST